VSRIPDPFAPTPESVLDEWGGDHVATVVFGPEGALETWGDTHRVVRLASVSKLITGYAALVALEEGAIALDDPAGPPGATVHDLLSHSSGVAFDSEQIVAAPRTRRVYSNTGWEALFAHLATATGMPWQQYLDEAVIGPLHLRSTTVRGSPAKDLWAPMADVARLVGELMAPTLIDPATMREATTVQFPELDGMLPGVGMQRPNPWGLVFEIRSHKAPHWTGARNSARTYGHFGGSGTFLWIDPDARIGLAGLGIREFGPWALDLWPRLSDAVLSRFADGAAH
jgi:CubicO group peptidase (beta-lactamase class C family)